MEFRIFFPLISDADREWLSLQEIDTYTEALQIMTIDSNAEVEKRVDSYFVTNHLYGLKYRQGKKLELKVQQREKVHAVFEVWNKTKLGKKAASHYRAEIHAAVSAQHPEFAIDDPSLAFEHRIDIGKERARTTVTQEVGGASLKYELTKILVNPPTNRRHWLSVVVEGDVGEVVRPFLKSAQNPLQLRSVLQTIQGLWGHRLGEVASKGFCAEKVIWKKEKPCPEGGNNDGTVKGSKRS
eukprot:CAMPEP_0173266138 /NCGR_PEP_ID=MMETSP1142-20121109/28990_1 /TAXON_ID=483371 /ORGANISM="non described non described, Strain CCMP2298" /LENGTH=239 /DNA_ID=CAMNT_0014202007 /DNA_START=62 /DNA_END=781 /DNA_ORIENTATION=+